MRFRALDIRRFSGALVLSGLLAVSAQMAGCAAEESNGPGSDALIILKTPKGGETFKVGDTLWVTWSVKDDPSDPINAVDPMLSHDDGKTWTAMRTSIPPDAPSWLRWGWAVKDSLTIGGVKTNLVGNSQLRLKVQQYSTQDPKKISAPSAAFTITR